MDIYGSLADDYYVNLNLNTEMNLPESRETILHFFERLQKQYPPMRHFFTRENGFGRENGDFVLEEDKDQGAQRWVSLEPRRVCSGFVNPASVEAAFQQHRLVLQLVPYMLSISPLDCGALDYMMGFDFNFRGNHDALVAEALGGGTALDGLSEAPGARIVNYEPNMTISLDEDCRTQARLMVETRSSAYQIRRGEFLEDQISVYFTVRQYGSLEAGAAFEEPLGDLRRQCEQLLDTYVIDAVLRPLAQAIATK